MLKLLISSSIIAIAVIFSGINAYADSDYGVLLTDNVKLGGTSSAGTCSDVDLTLSWSQIMRDNTAPDSEYSYQNTWNYQYNYPSGAVTNLTNFANGYNTAVTAGKGWAVTLLAMTEDLPTSSSDWGSYHKMVRIYTFDADTTFKQYSGYLSANKTLHYTDYFLNPNAGCRFQAWNTNGTGSAINFSYEKIFLLNGDIVYQPDYNGPDIPSTYEPPIPAETYYPRARYDFNGSTWVRAFDSNVDLCLPYDQASLPDDVLAPGAEAYVCARSTDVNIIYTLKDSSGTVIDTKTLRASESYEYNELVVPNTYTIEMQYEYTPDTSVRRYPLDAGVTLGKSVIEIDTSKGPISGLTEGKGCSESDGVRTCTTQSLTACFLMEAPFVDIPQCMENVNEIMRMLTFGSISFIKGDVYTECRTLGTVGDWLDLENKYVCPQVPKVVRDIVTPFITLALAMLLVVMITKLANRSNN